MGQFTRQRTSVRVGEHVFMCRAMSVVVDVTDDDSERVRAADWWIATVPDDHRDVMFFALFTVERLQARHDARPITIVTTAYRIHDIA